MAAIQSKWREPDASEERACNGPESETRQAAPMQARTLRGRFLEKLQFSLRRSAQNYRLKIADIKNFLQPFFGNMKLKSLTPLGLALLLFGCASVGKNFDSRKVQEIRKGETTEPQLVSMFGQPIQRGLSSERGVTLTWIYTEARVKGETFIPFAGAFVGGATTKTKTLLVSLDQAGKVAAYNYSGGGFESSGTIPDDPESNTNRAQLQSPRAGK